MSGGATGGSVNLQRRKVGEEETCLRRKDGLDKLERTRREVAIEGGSHSKHFVWMADLEWGLPWAEF